MLLEVRGAVSRMFARTFERRQIIFLQESRPSVAEAGADVKPYDGIHATAGVLPALIQHLHSPTFSTYLPELEMRTEDNQGRKWPPSTP